jgi:hypothetical protein
MIIASISIIASWLTIPLTKCVGLNLKSGLLVVYWSLRRQPIDDALLVVALGGESHGFIYDQWEFGLPSRSPRGRKKVN